MAQSKYPYHEFSGALQQKSTTHIKKPNEVRKVKNVDFATVLGAMLRRPGAQATSVSMPKLPVAANTLGAFIARFSSGTEIWAAQNDDAASPTEATLAYWTGPNPEDWQEIEDGITAGSEINMTDDNDEVWVSMYDAVLDQLGIPFTVNSDHDVSTTRQLQFAPRARFFIEFGGSIWAANAEVSGVRYRDRLYKSSGLMGAITFVRSAQTDPAGDFELTNQVPIMTSNTAPSGVADASSVASANFPAYKAFNGSNIANEDRWASNGTTGWLRYDFGASNPKVITHYAIVGMTPSATSDAENQCPKTWTFQGSNDGSAWDTLDTQTNVAAWTRGEKRSYVTANTTAYRYYRVNITLNQGNTSFASIAELELLNSPDNVDVLELEVDSVRYIKPGMELDFYEAGTDNLKYSITPTEVDKINDTFSFLPVTQNFSTSDVNTGTEEITLPDASKFATGTPIIFGSTGTVPAGLTAGTTYYAINVSSTTIKVATSELNASLGIAINLTDTGSGQHRVRLSYVFDNKDEIWKSGRKGKLTRFWNTDYRNPEAADWIKLPPTLDGTNDITAVGKISNRMFIFTENATIKYDGQNLIPLRNDVGCIAHRSIGYYDVFMVWLDAKGKIWIRNDEGGQQDVISEAIQETMALVPQSQLPEATAVCVDDKYKLYLGQIGGKSLRVCYNFRTNQWTEEWFTPKMPVQLEYTYEGNRKPHFFDATGQMWVDEVGTDDDGAAIHMEAELGNDNFGVDEDKNYHGLKIYSKNAVGTKLFVSIDDGEWVDCGQITQPVMKIPLNKVPKGTLFNARFVSSMKGDTPEIYKMVVWFTKEEDTFRATQR